MEKPNTTKQETHDLVGVELVRMIVTFIGVMAVAFFASLVVPRWLSPPEEGVERFNRQQEAQTELQERKPSELDGQINHVER